MTVRPDPAGSPRATPAGRTLVLAALALGAALVAACGATTGSPGASASAVAGASAGASAGSHDAPSGSASGQLPPQATPWPGGVVEAIVILGKADVDIQNAGADLGAAAAYEDLQAMWGAADGLATLIERLQTQVPRIADYPETAAAAKAYDAAFPDMLAGARQIRDSITAGDAAGLSAGSQTLAAGLAKYQDARRAVGPLVDQAILMQRILVK